MRIIGYLMLLTLFTWVAPGCEKSSNDSPAPAPDSKQILTNGSSRVWKLNKYFLDGTQQDLTPGQALFTKTYISDGKWSDSDNSSGTYLLDGFQNLTEITSVGGSSTTVYKINILTTTQLDVEYTYQSKTYRYVYAP